MSEKWGRIAGILIISTGIAVSSACSEPVETTSEPTRSSLETVPSETVISSFSETSVPDWFPLSDTEGTLLSYADNPAPVFAFDPDADQLLAYCYEQSGSYLPYVVSEAVPADGAPHLLYIPDYDRSYSVLFDREHTVWRVFDLSPGGLAPEGREWIVYYDRVFITERSSELRRESALGSTPRYYSIESGLYYPFRDGGVTLATDMNGDGATEMVNVRSENFGKKVNFDSLVRINGEDGFVISDVSSFSGAYITDTDTSDSRKEVVFEYTDGNGTPVSRIMRYDGNSIRSKVFYGRIDCAGDGKVSVWTEDPENTAGVPVVYIVNDRFEFALA